MSIAADAPLCRSMTCGLMGVIGAHLQVGARRQSPVARIDPAIFTSLARTTLGRPSVAKGATHP